MPGYIPCKQMVAHLAHNRNVNAHIIRVVVTKINAITHQYNHHMKL